MVLCCLWALSDSAILYVFFLFWQGVSVIVLLQEAPKRKHGASMAQVGWLYGGCIAASVSWLLARLLVRESIENDTDKAIISLWARG